MRTSMGRFVLVVLVAAAMVSVAVFAVEAPGRYKKDGNRCYWDANDNGPNQCTPRVPGRFKKDGNRCYWDANDQGADQCTPPKGRFKVDGSRCYWDANDSGPNQCDPRQIR